MAFANRKMARLEVKVVEVTQDPDTNVANAVQLLLDVQSVLGLVGEAKSTSDHRSAFETTTSPERWQFTGNEVEAKEG